MGYEQKGKTMVDLIDEAIDAVPGTMRMMANDVGEYMTTITRRNTGVDSGWLRSQIFQKRIVVYTISGDVRVYETGSYTEVDYAPHVEDGTGNWGPNHAPYEILPKPPNTTLTWIDAKTGKRVFAKKVMHPGSPGQHMFAIGVAMAESQFDRLVQPALRHFARAAEGRGLVPTYDEAKLVA
jgi:hypothetical protein